MNDLFYYVLFWHGDFSEIMESIPTPEPIKVSENVRLVITNPSEYVFLKTLSPTVRSAQDNINITSSMIMPDESVSIMFEEQ